MDMVLPRQMARAHLSTYFHWFGADEAQRETVERAYVAYRDEYNAKRESEKKELVELLLTIDRAPMPPPSAVRQLLRLRRQAMQKLWRIDENLLHAIEIVLSEEQAPLMLAIRSTRERSFYDFGNAPAPEMQIDLIKMFHDVELADDELRKVRTLIIEYASSIAVAVRQRHDAAIRLCEKVLESMTAAGFNEETAYDPTMSEVVMPMVVQEFLRNGCAVVKASNRIAQVNRQYVRLFAAQLPPDSAEALTSQYNLAAFPTVYGTEDSVGSRLTAALTRTDLSDEQRKAVTNLTRDYLNVREQIRQRLVRELTKYRESYSVFEHMAPDTEERRAHQEAIESLRTKLKDFQTTMVLILEEAVKSPADDL